MPKASTKLQGFLREYCISLHLSCHPCIVGLFGIAFHSEEHYCFAQELVIGKDLFAVIKPKASQPLRPSVVCQNPSIPDLTARQIMSFNPTSAPGKSQKI